MSRQSRQETLGHIENYLKEHYLFKYNCVSNRVEFKATTAPPGKPRILTDYCANSIRRELLNSGLNISNADFRSLINSDFTPSYDPFRNYFDSIPAWSEGKPDYISKMASRVETTNQELWQRCFRKWIVGVVGCALDEKVVNHTAIIFTGKQGIGKTTFLHNLMPSKLKNYYFEGTINPDIKDSLTHLSECLLINLDELENLRKNQTGGLKSLITRSEIRLRRPYGTINENFPRRASFCGSVNNKEFLIDSTGNRRFLCFEALYFNNQVLVDLNGMYAQALFLWQDGFQYWFDQDEIKEINLYNKDYEVVEPEEECLLAYFEPGEEEDSECMRKTSTQIHLSLVDKYGLPNTDSSRNKLGKALHANGYVRKKTNGQQLWLVKHKAAA